MAFRVRGMLKKGLLLINTCSGTIKIGPPLTITIDLIDKAVKIPDDSFIKF